MKFEKTILLPYHPLLNVSDAIDVFLYGNFLSFKWKKESTFECFLRRNAFRSVFWKGTTSEASLIMNTRVLHGIELRTGIWCLEANSYVKFEKTMLLPYSSCFRCFRCNKCVSQSKFPLSFQSTFECFLRRNAFLSGFEGKDSLSYVNVEH